MRYLTGGSGPVLVLLHGLMGYSFSWRHNLEALAQSLTVIAPDLPGMGYSSRVANPEAGLAPASQSLRTFLKRIGLSSGALLASSHGGAVALDALGASSSAFRLENLILVSPTNAWSRNGELTARTLATPVGRAIFRPLSRCMGPLHGYLMGRLYGNERLISPGTVEGYTYPIGIPGTLDYLFARVQNWREELQQVAAGLASFPQVPVLVMWGGRDSAVDPASAEILARQFPGAELAILPEAGHIPYEEVPKEFNRIVLDFMLRNGGRKL